MAEIEWRHDGSRLVLPVAILPSAVASNASELEIVDGLIDTGATGTGLRPDVAERLALPARGRRRIMTANGDIIVPEFRLRIGFYPGSFSGPAEAPSSAFPTVLDFGILAHALRPIFPYALLIGMDVLHLCDLFLTRRRKAKLVLP